jgi:sugar lactone lactonase YvrE
MSKSSATHGHARSSVAAQRAFAVLCAMGVSLCACDGMGSSDNADTLATGPSLGHDKADSTSASNASDAAGTAGSGPAAISGSDAGGGGSAAVVSDAGTAGASGTSAVTAGAGAAGEPAVAPVGTTSPTTPGGNQSGGQSGGPSITSSKPVIFWLDISGNRVWRANSDGTAKMIVAVGQGISTPDGVAVDLVNNYVYWTNMGSALGGANLGTLQRIKLNGTSIETIVPIGTTNTPEQIGIDAAHSMLYWCDREGAKVWRSKLDGSAPEILVSGHDLIQLVGIALDMDKQQFYFTDRMAKKIYRAGFEFPSGENDATRSDVEELFAFQGASMPIDVDLDLEKRQIYWTDRVQGTVHRASMQMPAGETSLDRDDIETLVSNLPDTLGISLDRVEKQLYFSQLNGDVWRAELDGTQRRVVVNTGAASGVKLVRMP